MPTRVPPTLYNFSHTWNLGDRVCSPSLYFDWLRDTVVADPSAYTPERPAIFGGGGMLHPGVDHVIAAAVRSGQRCATWSIGLNYHGVLAQLYPRFLDECAHTSLRERGNPWSHVPCVSCMAPEFDVARTIQPIHDTIIYQHRDWPLPGNLPRLTNACESLAVALTHLASGRTVLTNTFHGAYWAKLLGRHVTLHAPFSNRFLGIDDGPFDLAECRAANAAWSERLRTYFLA